MDMERDIFSILKEEHDEVKKLFREIQRGAEDADDLFDELSQSLDTHIRLEEELFYPVLQEDRALYDPVLEAYEEHNVARYLLRELKDLSTEDAVFTARLKVLNENIQHHIKEEEVIIFRLAKKYLSRQQAREIGDRFEREKQKMMAAAAG
jgi:iron-sulfur cluster repair protein YtfE (RIC family)